MKWASEKQGRVRVSWSDLLPLMGNRRRREVLPIAMDGALRIMCQALRQGFDVVLDEENLNGLSFGLFAARAQMEHAKVEFLTIRATVEECKRRNALKEHPVAELEIERKAERYADWLKK